MRVARSCLEKSRRLSRRLPAFSSTIITDDESPIPSLPTLPYQLLASRIFLPTTGLVPTPSTFKCSWKLCELSGDGSALSVHSSGSNRHSLCKSRKLESTDEEAQFSSTIDVIIVHNWAILHPYGGEFRGSSELSLKINY
jgi:hypothetical protein